MDLKETLRLHELWLKGDNKGKRAYLYRANLRGAELRGANLYKANLEGANLEGANLEVANLEVANLRGANLEGANLRGADLRGADLRGANLEEAILEGANLRGANLRGANLGGAILEGAILEGANLTDASLPHFQIVPETGSFEAWKATSTGVIKILIPEDAKRTSSLVGRKCRASYVVPMEDGGESPTHNIKLNYRANITVYADAFDSDIRVECTNGIHFFMTKKEAEEWLS